MLGPATEEEFQGSQAPPGSQRSEAPLARTGRAGDSLATPPTAGWRYRVQDKTWTEMSFFSAGTTASKESAPPPTPTPTVNTRVKVTDPAAEKGIKPDPAHPPHPLPRGNRKTTGHRPWVNDGIWFTCATDLYPQVYQAPSATPGKQPLTWPLPKSRWLETPRTTCFQVGRRQS